MLLTPAGCTTRQSTAAPDALIYRFRSVVSSCAGRCACDTHAETFPPYSALWTMSVSERGCRGASAAECLLCKLPSVLCSLQLLCHRHQGVAERLAQVLFTMVPGYAAQIPDFVFPEAEFSPMEEHTDLARRIGRLLADWDQAEHRLHTLLTDLLLR